MLAPLPCGVDVIVTQRTPTGRDEYGNDTYTTVDVTYSGCGFRPGTAGRNVAGSRVYGEDEFRHSVITRAEVTLPDGAVLSPIDLIQIPSLSPGHVYRMIGEPQQWSSQLTGATSMIQASIEWVEG